MGAQNNEATLNSASSPIKLEDLGQTLSLFEPEVLGVVPGWWAGWLYTGSNCFPKGWHMDKPR